jgi:hypothetical protein
MDQPVTSEIGDLPAGSKGIVIEVLGRRDPGLHAQLTIRSEAHRAEREAVERALGDDSSAVFGPNWELSDHGKRVETAIDDFLTAWPIE